MAKHFEPGHLVLLCNSKLKHYPRRFMSRWLGPYTLIQAIPHGAIKMKNEKNRNQFKVNGYRLKYYHRGEVTQFTLSMKPISEWPELNQVKDWKQALTKRQPSMFVYLVCVKKKTFLVTQVEQGEVVWAEPTRGT